MSETSTDQNPPSTTPVVPTQQEEKPGAAIHKAMAQLESYKQAAKGYTVTEKDVENAADLFQKAHKSGRRLNSQERERALLDQALPVPSISPQTTGKNK